MRPALVNDGTTWTNSGWFTITDAPHPVELDWRAATAAAANNGGLSLWIDRARLGPVNGIDTGTRGPYYFDAFESRRQTYIGP